MSDRFAERRAARARVEQADRTIYDHLTEADMTFEDLAKVTHARCETDTIEVSAVALAELLNRVTKGLR